MATLKNYKRKTVKGQEDVEVYTPGAFGARLAKGSDEESAKKKRGVLPFSVEEEKGSYKTPQVIEGEPGQRDRRKEPVQTGGSVEAPKKKSNLLDDIKAEISSPTPPPLAPAAKTKTENTPSPAKPAAPSKPSTPPKAAEAPAAKPAAPEQKKRKRMSTDPKEQGRVVAQSVVDGFVGALRGQAAKRGGHLSVEDVDALSSSFERQADKLADSFARQLKSFSDAKAKSHWTQERVNSLNRILVKRFSHLLIDESELKTKPEGLSRRMLPGFFHALEMMIGKEQLAAFEQDANRITGKLRERLGDDFSWDHAYAHRDSKALILDLLVAAAPHFEELDKRMAWMLGLINADLPAPKPQSANPDWKLDQIGLVRVLDALFADLRTALEDDLGRLRITKRHGFEVLEALLEAFETFDKKIAAAQES